MSNQPVLTPTVDFPFLAEELNGARISLQIFTRNRGETVVRETAAIGEIHVKAPRGSRRGGIFVITDLEPVSYGVARNVHIPLEEPHMPFLKRAPEGSGFDFQCHDPAVSVQLEQQSA